MQRDGAVFTSDWLTGLAMEGRVYVAQGGSATTPITFGAGSIDVTEPDLDISVPAGTLVIPLSIQVVFETFGTTLLLEGMASIGRGGAQGTGTAVTPTSLRVDAPSTSGVTVLAAGEADATNHTANATEFWRFGKNKTVDIATADDDSTDVQTRFEWSAVKTGIWPILYSASAASRLTVFAGAQAGTGFITVVYAELPGAAIS